MQMITSEDYINYCLQEPLVEECCIGLIAYTRSLSLYELSEYGCNLLSELVVEALKLCLARDRALCMKVEGFLAGSRKADVLERGAFYNDLFNDVIQSNEFKGLLIREGINGNSSADR